MITVFITDDHYMVVEGIRSLLANEQDIGMIGSASNAESTRAFLKNRQPDVLLLDVNLPDGNGVDFCKELKKQFPDMAILGVSTFNQVSYIKEMMENGASGYLLKNASQQELTEAIRLASVGQTYMPFEVAKSLHAAKAQESEQIILGRREKEILEWIKDGYTNGEMAAEMNLSVHTVDTYRKSLLSKLNARNTAELITKAFQLKLISME